MSLIRGKRLVWVFDGQRYCEAECQFGRYHVYITDSGLYKWDLSSFVDDLSIHQGHEETIELAQAACQSDHDLRAMASIQVGPFEWKDDAAVLGDICLAVWMVPHSTTWQWDVSHMVMQAITYGIEDTRAEAITAAEQFVTRLVMVERE